MKRTVYLLSIIPITRVMDAVLTFIGVSMMGHYELNSCMRGIVYNLPLSVIFQLGASALMISLLYTMSLRKKHQSAWLGIVIVLCTISAIPVVLNTGTLMGMIHLPASLEATWSICK